MRRVFGFILSSKRLVCFLNYLRTNALAAVMGFFIFSTLIWLTGMLDFLFEEDFRHFKWPPYLDVRKEVVDELLHVPNAGNATYQSWNQFALLLRPNCKESRFTRNKFILIVVKTAPHRYTYREAVRAAYGKVVEQSGFRLRTVFAMGKPPDESTVGTLYDEAALYGDMLVGDFTDSYRNNTYKFLNSIDFAQSYCGENRPVTYLFLVDDDYLVSPRNLVVEARRHVPNKRLYMGWRFFSSPYRFFFHKHRVSLEEYPYAAYPPYVTAGAVLLTGQTVKEFYLAVKYMKIFPLDDIYAGSMAYLLGINAVHNDNFCVSCPRASTAAEEWQNWRAYIAVHNFRPTELVEMYRQVVEADSPPSS